MSMAELESAFLQADAAGDAESASVLAAEIENRRRVGGVFKDPAIARNAASEAFAGGRKMEDISMLGKFNGGLNHGARVIGSAVQDVLPKSASDWIDKNVWDGKRKETLNNGAAFVKDAGFPAQAGAFINEAAPVATAALATGGASLPASLAAQGGTAMLTTPGDLSQRSMSGAMALGGEALGRALPGIASRLVQPAGKLSPDAQLLVDNGIFPTLGGAIGPAAKATEDKLMSVPGIGDVLGYGRRGATHDLNAWLANRSGVSPKVTPQEYLRDPRGVQARVGTHLDNAFDRGVNGMVFDPNTHQFKDSLNAAVRSNRVTTSGLDDFNSHYGHMRRDYNLPPSYIDGSTQPSPINAPQLVNGQPKPPQMMDGRGVQSWGQDWRTRGSEYANSLSPGDKPTGRAMNSARYALLDEVDRQGIGANTDALRLANRQWADSQVLRDAADATGSVKNSGVASPGTILTNFKRHAEDGNYGRAFREGRAPGQDVAEAANRAIGSNYPDSGTAGRFSVASMLYGGMNLVNPKTLGLAIGGSALSTPGGRRYGVGQLFDWQNPVSEALRRMIPRAGDLGSATMSGLNTNHEARYREEY